MDMTDSIAPASDQLDAVDLIGGPRTFTIEKVSAGSPEQPVDIHLAEFPRVWRPSKSMRRVLVACWGPESATYVGRRLTLFCDPDVMFGKDRVGGTRISHMSHLDKRKSVPLLISRGKSAMFTVEVLADAAPVNAAPTRSEPTAAQVAACTDVDALKVMYDAAGSPEMRAQIRARKAELNTPVAAPPAPDDGPGPSDADWDAMGQPATS